MSRKFFSLKETLFLIFIVILPLLTLFISKNKDVALKLIGKYYILLLLILLSTILYNSFIMLCGHYIISKKKKNNTNSANTAVILSNHDFFCLNHWLTSSYSYNFKVFFKYLELRNDIRYNVYDNLTKPEFNNIISNKKIKNIYLFGHGTRHMFGLYEDKPVYYCDFQNKRINKDFVAQYHCNHHYGKSLADYVVDKDKRKYCEITYEAWSRPGINGFLKHKYKEKHKKQKKIKKNV